MNSKPKVALIALCRLGFDSDPLSPFETLSSSLSHSLLEKKIKKNKQRETKQKDREK